jgi:hypothetical protein
MCEAAPADDEPRAMWADDQGGERGELVMVQCALARGELTPAASGVLRVRQRELLAANGHAWSGLEPWAMRCRYRRGFVELATFTATTFLDHADEIFAVAPLLASIALEDLTDAHVTALLDHPMYPQIRGLALSHTSDAGLRVAADRGAFARLESLGLQEIDPSLLTELAATKQLQNLTRLELFSNNGVHPSLLESMPRLRALSLSFGDEPFQHVAALPHTLTQLTITAGSLDDLARSPIARQLEQLTLHDARATGALPQLAAFPKLRSLDLFAAHRMTIEAEFAESPLPALREFRAHDLTPACVDALAEKLGPQLELLELIGYKPEDDLATARALVAGDVFANPIATARAPLFAGELTNAPMWDYPFVRFRPKRM